ncbi:uncharacterized protein N7484_008262 [Penicillium longicatenatum]|uniref:uncharacterized protein n=1 Tax=Penicillium longicatenatum TaxID=1561947 RepID=UPI002546CD6D|nr:uncharacterized protein N7484_008262 [Penicillium longicatenatum]KAJ5634949.1 hypothetical protein N7484_008262 [Penicillium longicatenatum]
MARYVKTSTCLHTNQKSYRAIIEFMKAYLKGPIYPIYTSHSFYKDNMALATYLYIQPILLVAILSIKISNTIKYYLGRYTSANLSTIILNILKKYEIQNRVLAITTNNVSNNNTLVSLVPYNLYKYKPLTSRYLLFPLD